MKVVIDFATSASIIEFIPFLGNDIKKYQEKFEEWYYEEDATGCSSQRSGLSYTIFDVNVVIDWIKEVAPEANPVILVERMKPEDVDSSLPGMYF
ncbi:MAG: hypothetical protein IKD76_00320 [Clostridia bacterium]|nr:hypothetical protein [Clostridia bacterium]